MEGFSMYIYIYIQIQNKTEETQEWAHFLTLSIASKKKRSQFTLEIYPFVIESEWYVSRINIR